MRAKTLVELFGHNLVGRTVLTDRVGAWPGGPAEVIQIKPDAKAPEISFQVRHKTAADPLKPSRYWEIGVFDHENVELFSTPKEAA